MKFDGADNSKAAWKRWRRFGSQKAASYGSATASVGGNILHAMIKITGPVPPVLAGLIATSHGLAVLTGFDPEKEN